MIIAGLILAIAARIPHSARHFGISLHPGAVDRDLRGRVHNFSKYDPQSTFHTKARRRLARRLSEQRCEDQNVSTGDFSECPCLCSFFILDFNFTSQKKQQQHTLSRCYLC